VARAEAPRAAGDIEVSATGAAGDGETDDTGAIQAAIDRVARQGGGRAVLGAGRVYRASTLELRDHVELHLERGATLSALPNWDAYAPGPAVSGLSSGVLGGASGEGRALVRARGASDVAIGGPGRIDGGGRHFVAEDLGPIYRMPTERPFTVFLVDCRGVSVRDVEIVDAAYWTLRLSRCEDVVVEGVRIHNDPKLPNNDGIDLDWCRRVRVSGCDIDTGDDAISVKTCDEFAGDGAAEDIVVSGCTLRSRSSAVVIGCDLVGPVRRVVMSGCTIRASHRGVSVNCSQQGSVEDVIVADCVVETQYEDDAWWGNGEPVYISAEPWHDRVGTVRGVSVRNLVCRSENGVTVQAAEPGLVRDVHLDAVTVTLGSWTGRPGGRLDLRPSSRAAFLERATAGFRLEHAQHVGLRDCRVAWSGPTRPWWGQPIEVVGSTGVDLGGLRY
jgi:hypothetical protein